MTCKAKGQINTYQWFINGLAPAGSRIQLSPDKRTLTIRNLTRWENKGPYVCGIQNLFYSSRSDPFTLNVAYGPDGATIIQTPDVYPIGIRVNFSCSAPSNPHSQFTWFYNGRFLSNASAMFVTATLRHTGNYTCIASNSVTGLVRNQTKIITIYAPLSKPAILISNKTAVESKDFSMTCKAKGQINTYQWFINGLAPADSRIQLSRDKRTLTIRRLTRRENKGPYVCEIQNPLFRNRSDPFTLNVAYGPDGATIIQTPDVYPIGIRVNFSCSAPSNPRSQFTWLYNGRFFSNTSAVFVTAALRHTGNYTCIASNSVTGLVRNQTKIITIYAPLSKPTILTSNNTAVETKDFSLTCNGTGQIHAYQWLINGLAPADSRIQLSPDKRTLTIRRLTRRENKGPYVCEIQNPLSRNRSDPFTQYVAYGPDIATIVQTPDVYPTGANITFSCSAKSNPSSQFTWLHNGQIFSNAASTYVTATLMHTGTYTCKASNSFTGLMHTQTKNITIYDGPDTAMIVRTPDVYPTGANITFSCSAQSNPPSQFTWLHNGQRVSNSATFSIIASLNHAGSHICIASNSFTGLMLTQTKNITIYAQLSKPTILTSNNTAVETKDFSLTCNGTGQIHAYQWLINGLAPADSRIQLSPDKRTLTIRRLTRRENKGPYVCEIQNPLSRNRSDPFTLDVAYGPDTPRIIPTVDQYPVGANIMLICSAKSKPPAQFTWFHNRKKLRHSAKLSITNVSLNHAGTYICHASNSYTGLNSTKHKTLTIYAKEKNTTLSAEDKNLTINAEFTIYENLMKHNKTINSTSFVIENGTAVLTCNTEDEDLPDIWWYFNNKRLILNDRMTLSEYGQTLTIMPVKREDSGAYRCEMWNPFLVHTSNSFNLVVSYGPEEIKILPKHVHGQIEVLLKKKLILECWANSQPPAQYIWQVNGSSISGNSGNTYTISQASWEHAGTYTCVAMNKVANTTISTKITVKVIEASGGSSLSGGTITVIVAGVVEKYLMKPTLTISSIGIIMDNGTVVLTCNAENEYSSIARENAGT
uniref:Ig-like domain-containing protein n=1 Tax=Monodelphis domestica TaxID=13616 RepID=A0A5F8HJK9_MONDO